MDTSFQGRVAFITGSGSGIGREMALAFARDGARVVVNDVNAQAGQQTVDLVTQAGGDARLAVCDITDLAQIKRTAQEAVDAFGSIDILVNNAAVLIAHEMFLETDPDKCDKEIKVALYGTMNCCRAIVPGMIARGYGKVVNIVTDAARVGQERQCNYSAAKGGVITFTKSFAKEVGRHNINVNAVSPGATNSPIRQAMLKEMEAKIGAEKVAEREEKVKRMYALRRIGEAEDISNAVLFLASDRARHVTGQILSVNGGFAMPG
ncbi:3-oxoacyl-[acyl-carrier-protein] reductase FabG [Pigmentiphaga humi]|uniref:3-oxoacyl-[acyl-carrier-protein] reductase FabG n=1 Tax=Pigmentiphaga humi TaxID=2478468 RepID=A0A3P4B6D3_9BURK|nr:SDR family oxidoreductase [Pigmentiphaga humi]VCU71632.1 3-oxoacyl-[acyl-carrier-protein] reductase FabG [Pigmentiphaga humi]